MVKILALKPTGISVTAKVQLLRQKFTMEDRRSITTYKQVKQNVTNSNEEEPTLQRQIKRALSHTHPQRNLTKQREKKL